MKRANKDLRLYYRFWTLLLFVVLVAAFAQTLDAEESPEGGNKSALARVVCDGRGGYTAIYAPQEATELDRRCLEEHEQEHIAFMNTFWPDACKDAPFESRITVHSTVKSISECLASVVSLECYTRHGRPDIGLSVFHTNAYGCSLSDGKAFLKEHRNIRAVIADNPNLTATFWVHDGDYKQYKTFPTVHRGEQ